MTNSTAAANANENLSIEVKETNVLSEVQVDETNVLSKEQIESRVEKAKRLFARVNSSRKATLVEKLEFAKFLLETKKELKNEFYKHITEDVISRKQVGRFLKIILTIESVKNFVQGMSHKYKEADKIEANLALLVEDTRVTSLTKEEIEKMKEPTVATIENAKFADSDEDFLKAIEGDEEILKSIKEKKSEISKEKKSESDAEAKEKEIELQKEIASKKPENMDIDTYQNLLKEEKTTLISLYQAQLDELNNYLKELSELREITKTSGQYKLIGLKNHLEEA